MFNKGQVYKILKDSFKVSDDSLAILLANKVNFAIGDKAISLEVGSYKKVYTFTNLVNTAVKTPTPAQIVEVNVFVAEYINDLKNVLLLDSAPKGKLYANGGSSKPANIKVSSSQVPFVDLKQLETMPMCKLREADHLYQRVYGTSKDSVYRLVAFNKSIKVAVRINNSNVSIRVEGDLTPDVVSAFNKVLITSKSPEYLSGHFSCTLCGVEKLIGSVLVGSKIEYTSPIPHIEKIIS